MNFLNAFEWKYVNAVRKTDNENSGGTHFVSDFAKAPCDLLIIPKSSRVEFRVTYLNGDKSVMDTPFMRDEGYIVPRSSFYALEIRYTDSNKAPTLEELKELGFTVTPFEASQNIDVFDAPLGSFSLAPYMSGLKMAKTIKENMKAISPFGEYGHQSMTVFINGKGYTVYTANNITMKEYDCNTFSRLAVYDIDEPEKARFFTVAKQGDNGGIKIDGVSSLVSIVYDGEKLACNCYGFVNGIITEFYRAFDMEKEEFGELQVCKIIKGDQVRDFTNRSIAELFGSEYGLTKMNLEMGVGPYFKYEDEWYTWLYTGDKRFCGILLKTRDFKNYEFVMVPEEPRGANCEIIPYFFKGYLYVAFRRDYKLQRLEVVKYDMKGLRPLESIVLKDTAMRPYFYEYNDELYLIHSPHLRHYTSIVKLSTDRLFRMSKPVASIENMHICTPCPIMYKGELYLTFSSRQGSYSQIFISHVSPKIPYTEEQVGDAFLKLIEG